MQRIPNSKLKKPKLAQRSFKKDYDRCVQFAPIFCVSDQRFSGQDAFLPLDSEPHASERYTKLLPRKRGHYEVTGASKNALQILQDGLEDTLFVLRTTVSTISRSQCSDKKPLRRESPVRKNPVRTKNLKATAKEPTKPMLSTNT